MGDPHTPPPYLDCAAVAAELHIAVGTVHDYHSSGRIPPADAVFGSSPVWLPETIAAYERRLGESAASRARANVYREVQG